MIDHRRPSSGQSVSRHRGHDVHTHTVLVATSTVVVGDYSASSSSSWLVTYCRTTTASYMNRPIGYSYVCVCIISCCCSTCLATVPLRRHSERVSWPTSLCVVCCGSESVTVSVCARARERTSEQMHAERWARDACIWKLRWDGSVARTTRILLRSLPRSVLFMHACLPSEFRCALLHTTVWQQMDHTQSLDRFSRPVPLCRKYTTVTSSFVRA